MDYAVKNNDERTDHRDAEDDGSSSVHSRVSGLESDDQQPSVSVRDMIKRYNSATKPKVVCMNGRPLAQQPPGAKCSFFGVNKITPQTDGKDKMDKADKAEKTGPKCGMCTRNKVCEPCTAGTSQPVKPAASELDNSKINVPSYVESLSIKPQTLNATKLMRDLDNLSAQKDKHMSSDSVEEASLHPLETSYQSRTTIAKTASGVRITIDIFFDQATGSDTVGSRIETDIPNSRILSEFQQQAMLANSSQMEDT